MELALIIIFIAYLAVKFFEYFLDYLNYKHLELYGSKVPEGFENVVDKEKLENIRNYTVEKIRFGIISSVYDVAILLIFIFSGLLNFYNSWILSLKLPFVFSTILFLLILVYAHTLLDIPFSLYSTFRIEKKYGFNTMTVKLWIIDMVKSLIISTILLSILCAAAIYLISICPDSWWIWVWGLFFLFTLFIMYISPYVLEPLFNKFVPVENEELSFALTKLMSKIGIKVSKVLKMDASKRTKHTNAYFSGIGNVKRIVLFDTLLEKMSQDEILSVVAHEGGHWKKKHIIKNIFLFEILALIFFYIAFNLVDNNMLLNVFGVNAGIGTEAIYLFPVKIFLLNFLFGIVMFPITPLFYSLSRKFERQADKFAVELIGTPDFLVEALIKLSADNLSNLHPHPLYAAFHYSHPGVQKRIKYLKSFSKD